MGLGARAPPVLPLSSPSTSQALTSVRLLATRYIKIHRSRQLRYLGVVAAGLQGARVATGLQGPAAEMVRGAQV